MDVMMKFLVLALFLFSSTLWARWSVTTFNIRNFDRDRSVSTNLEELHKTLITMKSEVYAFQEVVNVKSFQAFIARALPGYSVRLSACGGTGRQNLALVYDSRVFQFVEQQEDLSFSGSSSQGCGSLRPVLLVTLRSLKSKDNFVFGLVHLKAGGNAQAYAQRWQQYQKLIGLSKKYEKQTLILLGDFNTTGYLEKNEDYLRFDQFLLNADMKSLSENLGCSSYWEGASRGTYHEPSVLDHIVISRDYARQVASVQVGTHCAKQDCRPSTPYELGVTYQEVSDHCPIQATFK